MSTFVGDNPKVIFWHRELPPLDAEPIGEHTVEATSSRMPGTIAHRDELWTRCEDELMAQTHHRLVEEIARLGGRYVHVRGSRSIHAMTMPQEKHGFMAASGTRVPVVACGRP